MKNKVVYGQDKNYNGKLPKAVVDSAVKKFKERYREHNYDTREINAFELNGGTGLTKGAQEVWNEFSEWCCGNSIDAIYNTSDEIDSIKTNLRNRVDNKNKIVLIESSD